MRRLVLTALVCLLVVSSAGCSGLLNSDSHPTETTTTTPSPTTETTPSTTASPEQLAPGLTTDGVTDALALADAHRENVYNHTFVKHTHFQRLNDTESAHLQETLYYANESHWRWNRTGEGMGIALGVTNGTLVQYADGEEVRYMIRSAETVRYGVRQISMRSDAPPMPPENALPEHVYARGLIYTLFASDNVSVERGDGVAARVTGTAPELTIRGEAATNVEFTATVTEDGLVRSLDLADQQGERSIEHTIIFNRTTTNPVERPDWYSQARNKSDVFLDQ